MLLVIDNYDSFVFNIARYCTELGWNAQVFRNDALELDEIAQLSPSAIIISPGPASPVTAGLSLDVVRHLSGMIPILGVCLGHQCIGAAFGGLIEHAREPMHGRASEICHAKKGLFQGLPMPLTVGRYHSLMVVETPEFDREIQVTARSKSGEIMALAHTTHPTLGVQFHPESVLSQHGHQIFANFFMIAEEWQSNVPA